MFTKNFNSLPDSLIEATKKIMTEASNEAPNIQRLTLTQEEISSINELMSVAEEALNEYVVNQAAHEKITKERDAGNEAMKVAHNAPDRAHDALSNLHDRLSSAHPEQKAVKAHLASAIDMLKRAKNAPNDKERAQHLDNARDAHQKAHKLLGTHLQNNAQQLSRQNVHVEEVQKNEEMMPKGMSMKERTAFHMAAAAAAKEGKRHFEFGGKKYPATMSKDVASKINEEQIEEALSPDAKKRRDELKAKVRAAKDAYKEISKQANSPKSGLAPLKTTVTPKEHESEDPEESARKHPIDRLRRIALSTGGGHFEYDNGEKHKISRDVARTIVKHYEVPSEQGGLKPYQKEKLQSDITKSHDHMMKHYNSISGTNEAKKLDEVPIETIKQVRTFNVEETDDETPPFEPDKKKKYTGSAKSRATWLAKHARDTMKKQMKTEQVKPGGDMAPNTHIPEGQIRFKKFSSPEAARQGLSGVVSGQTRTTKIGEPSKPQKMDAKPSSERKPLEDRLGEEPIDEREMTKAEMNKREKIVMRLKDKMAGFKKRYGERAKDVMYATATKMAMKEETPKGKTMTGQTPDGIKENPPMSTKEGIGIKSTTT